MPDNKQLFLFDIDGTIALDDTLFDGAQELLDYIRYIGGTAMYITNNSTKSRSDYVEKFARWGLTVPKEHFVTASHVSCLHMSKHFRGRKVFTVGTASFIRELRSWGVDVTQEPESDAACVLVGFDSELTYAKLQHACEILFRNPAAELIAANPDLRCPVEFGFVPDCGAITQVIEKTTNRKPLYLGKPNPLVVDLCREISGHNKSETLVIGDRLYTDIACGINADVETALVLTGEATAEDLKDTPYRPTFVYSNIREFARHLSAAKK